MVANSLPFTQVNVIIARKNSFIINEVMIGIDFAQFNLEEKEYINL